MWRRSFRTSWRGYSSWTGGTETRKSDTAGWPVSEMERRVSAMGTDDTSGSDECVRTDRCDHGADRGLHIRTDLGQRREFATTGGRWRCERVVNGRNGGKDPKPACIIDHTPDGSGDDVGWSAMGTAGAGGRSLQHVRAQRRGDGANGRLFVRADSGCGGG